MAEFRTDEETIELAKSWWRENGWKLFTTIALALAVVLGYRAWQDHTRQRDEAAAEQFRQFEQTQDSTAAGVAQTRQFLYAQLKSEYASSGYAPLAGMLEAQRLAGAKDFVGAAKELQWVIGATSSPHLKDVARVRLARVQWAQADTAAALKTLATIDDAGFTAQLAELRGDILLAQGDRAAAYTAYQAAVTAAGKTPPPLLIMKRDDIAPLSVVSAVAPLSAIAGGATH